MECGLRHLFAGEKLLPDEWFQKLRQLMWSGAGSGLKDVQFLLFLINIFWRANGFLCACVFPFSVGEIASNTGTSCHKTGEVQAEGRDG